jgi:hypothetical protein
VVTDVIRTFAAEFSPLPPVHVPLRKHPQAAYGWPADGVAEKIRIRGGSIGYGWRLREWPGVLLTAEPHAVWVDPDWTLIDVTRDVADGDMSLFVPAPQPSATGQRPPTQCHVLYAAPDRSEAAAERIAGMTTGQRAYEDRRAQKAGQPLEAWIRDKYFNDPLPGLIAAFIEACDTFDAQLPTLPGLIQAATEAAEEQPPPSPDAQEPADEAAAPTDDPSGAAAETPPVQSGPTVGIEKEPQHDGAADNQFGVANDEADDDRAFDDFKEDETWLAVDNLDDWSRKRDTCRKAILRAMSAD